MLQPGAALPGQRSISSPHFAVFYLLNRSQSYFHAVREAFVQHTSSECSHELLARPLSNVGRAVGTQQPVEQSLWIYVGHVG